MTTDEAGEARRQAFHAEKKSRQERFLAYRASVLEGPSGQLTLNDFYEDLEDVGFSFKSPPRAWLTRDMSHEHAGWEAQIDSPDDVSDRFRYRFADRKWQNGRYGVWFDSLQKCIEHIVARAEERVEVLEKGVLVARSELREWAEFLAATQEKGCAD